MQVWRYVTLKHTGIIENIFFYITSQIYFCHLQRLINLYILENVNSVKSHLSVLLNAPLYHNTVLVHADVTCVQWSIYFISCDPVSSNQECA